MTSHPARLRDAASMYAHRRRRQQLAATLPTGKRSHAPVYHERTAPRLIGHCANLPHKLAPDQKINATAVLRAATRQDARTRIRRRPDHDGVSTTPRIGNSAPSVDPAHTHSHAPPELATCQVHTTCTHRTTTPIASTPRASRVEFAVASKVRDAPLTWSPFSASSCTWRRGVRPSPSRARRRAGSDRPWPAHHRPCTSARRTHRQRGR